MMEIQKEVRMICSLKKLLFSFILAIFVSVIIIYAGQVIQTQESDSWEGIEVDLIGLKINNNIITLRFKFRNTGDASQEVQFYFKDCYIMDETNQKKYFVLKDSDGQFIGGPKDKEWEGGRFSARIGHSKSKSAWMKFPEPTDNPETITISIPGVFPFEEVELTK